RRSAHPTPPLRGPQCTSHFALRVCARRKIRTLALRFQPPALRLRTPRHTRHFQHFPTPATSQKIFFPECRSSDNGLVVMLKAWLTQPVFHITDPLLQG